MSNVHLITEADWPSIDAIQRACYPADAQEDLNTMRCHWLHSPQTCFVSKRNGRVEGYALSHPWKLRRPPPINTVYSSLPKDPDSLYLHDVAVFPHARGLGLAARLIQHALSAARRHGLTACSLISVQRSRAFWEKLGFSVETNLPDGFFDAAHTHYRDHECVYMILR